ncbi:hypothetical protein CVO96_06500 [Deinococcus koreensis]|uniref:VCBS repeat-containing protein n=1 Tax=Deinococcus koreensis TaxID=2054903 RepID=A0A2K3UX18_9DEIO|nr:hypothetical protein CVO96_06500 [Deinococcus koreensis]
MGGLGLSGLGAGLANAAPAPLPVLMGSPGQEAPLLLGAWEPGRWIAAGPALASRLSGQERYRRQALWGPPSTVRGGRAVSLGVPCEDAFHVPVTPGAAPGAFEVFASPALNTRPRPVTPLPTGLTAYREIVRQELVRRGLRTPQVRLTALIRADLDGNGTQEVIIEASRFVQRQGEFPPPVGQPGDYSLLLLRHVVAGQVRTVVLGEHVAPLRPWNPDSADPMPMATLHRLAGIADLNGDGRMEVLTHGAYYEGDAFSAQEWTPTGGLKIRLESGCGV